MQGLCVCICVHVHLCVCVHMSLCANYCVCIHVSVHVCINVHMHTHAILTYQGGDKDQGRWAEVFYEILSSCLDWDVLTLRKNRWFSCFKPFMVTEYQEPYSIKILCINRWPKRNWNIFNKICIFCQWGHRWQEAQIFQKRPHTSACFVTLNVCSGDYWHRGC